MKEPTKADLAAAVTRLTGENEALRDLLAAVRAYADLPRPASYSAHDNMYEYELERRADVIAVWADGDQGDMAPDVYVLVIRDRAKHLREEAARPVRYEVRGAAPEADELHAEPEPVSPEVAEQLYDAIVNGTPVVVYADGCPASTDLD